MADLDRLQTGLVNADKAGDTEAATAFATEIRRIQADSAPAKPAPAPAKEPDGMLGRKSPLGLPEAALGAVTGAATSFAGNLAGLGAIPLHALGAIKTDPTQVQKNVQEMAYQPRSQAGKELLNMAAVPGDLWHRFAKGSGEIAAPPQTSGPLRSAFGSAIQGGIENLPMMLGGGAPKAAEAASGALKTGAQDVMRSALKPSVTMGPEKSASAVNTLLDEGLNVTHGGVEKLQERIGGLNDRISKLIENSPAVIDKEKAASGVFGLIEKFKKQVAPMEDVSAIEKAWDEFMDHPLLQGNEIPVKTAQEIKQGTYKALGSKSYGELKGADIEAQKTLARGLKEEIAAAVPEVRKLNADESKLLVALTPLERRVMVEANKNPVGLGWLTLSPSHFMGWMADRSGLFKSLIARMLNTGSEGMPSMNVAGPIGGAALSTQIAPPPQ